MGLLKTLKSLLYSIRPSACIASGLIAIAGLAPTQREIKLSIILFIGAFCCSAFCFLLNDCFDREKDLMNKKLRPIATGNLPLKTAVIASILFFTIFLIISMQVATGALIVCLVSSIMILTYSHINRNFGFLANVVVAITVCLGFWYGAILRSYSIEALILSLFIFFVIIAREILLDWLDVEGDRAYGKPSIPITVGDRTWIIVGLFYLLSTIFLSYGIYTSVAFVNQLMFVLALVAMWLPFIPLMKSISRKYILLNVRTSHLILLFIFIERVVF